MKQVRSRKSSSKVNAWPRKVQPGRAIVTVYRRRTPSGGTAFMVANYADGNRRRFDCYASEAEALAEAERLAKRLDSRDFVAASMTKEQAIEYANAVQNLKPFGLSLGAVVHTIIQAVKIAGDLQSVILAAESFARRNRRSTPKRVSEIVAELLSVKEARGASKRYLEDLRHRLNRFSGDFQRDACNITTPEIQAWLDRQKMAAQSYANTRRVLHLFFKFAVARGYAVDNPVEEVERVKVRGGDIEIFTPLEITRLLGAASPEFLPCLAIGAFAGLRSAEIERMEWSDIRLADRCIVVGASQAKTASRRIVPIHDNLAAWLTPYAKLDGKVWKGGHNRFYKAEQATAAATKVEADERAGIKADEPVRWKPNGLRHSYGSYRFAQLGDAGRVSGEMGNTPEVVHRHYRELVTPAEAEKWFNIRPESPADVLPISAKA